MILPIITDGNPILRTRGADVTDFNDPEIQRLIDDMISTMYEKDGVGLAAPQVAAPYQVAVIVPDPEQFQKYRKKSSDALILINPVITRHSFLTKVGEEGCLSVPGIWGHVRRWKSITVAYIDRQGNKQKLHAKGLMARVIQHETDHLNGILFIDRAEKIYQLTAL